MEPIATTGQGFGEYLLPEGKSFEWMRVSSLVQQAAMGIFFSLSAALSIALMTLSPIVGVTLLLGSSTMIARVALSILGILRQTPPTNDTFPAELEQTVSPLNTPCPQEYTGFPTADSRESQEWKLHLIRAAEKSIVLSGCYCGGVAFDETLDSIEERMGEKPELKTLILASDLFISPSNQGKMNRLKARFGDRFQCVIHPEYTPYVSPETAKLQMTVNHTKVLVVDQSFAILGGSGIVSFWTQNHGISPPETPKESLNPGYDLIGADGYRDMDFVFHSPHQRGVGARIHMEMVKLATHLSGKKIDLPLAENQTRCMEFENRQEKVGGLQITPFATGPERKENAYRQELIRSIERAERSITIDHLFFHPSAPLLTALISAAKRGVQITILTNKTESDSPGAHSLFGELSQREMRRLCKLAPKGRVEIYEYGVAQSTLHKKVIVIDGKTSFIGSSNIGYKSLEAQGDYELNLKVDSVPFAHSVLASVEQDKAICSRISDDEAAKTPFLMELGALAQSLLTTPLL